MASAAPWWQRDRNRFGVDSIQLFNSESGEARDGTRTWLAQVSYKAAIHGGRPGGGGFGTRLPEVRSDRMFDEERR